jgi:hypothetical protein
MGTRASLGVKLNGERGVTNEVKPFHSPVICIDIADLDLSAVHVLAGR